MWRYISYCYVYCDLRIGYHMSLICTDLNRDCWFGRRHAQSEREAENDRKDSAVSSVPNSAPEGV